MADCTFKVCFKGLSEGEELKTLVIYVLYSITQ